MNTALATKPPKGVVLPPPFDQLRKLALSVYKPPFRYERGYIFDSANHMVGDDGDVGGHLNTEHAVAARVRGWGRLQQMPHGAHIQDEIGRMVAEALTEFFAKEKAND